MVNGSWIFKHYRSRSTLVCNPLPVIVTTRMIAFLRSGIPINLYLPPYWEGGEPKIYINRTIESSRSLSPDSDPNGAQVLSSGTLGTSGVGKSQPCQSNWPTVDGAEIRRSPVEVGSLSHDLQGFIHPRWLFGISSINSIQNGDLRSGCFLHPFRGFLTGFLTSSTVGVPHVSLIPGQVAIFLGTALEMMYKRHWSYKIYPPEV